MAKKKDLYEVIENSIRIGTEFAEIALVFKDKEAARIANSAYNNAIKAKITLLLEHKLTSENFIIPNIPKLLEEERENGTTTSE